MRNATNPRTSRSWSSRAALIGTAALVAIAPVFVSVTAANADDSFAVTSPTQGQTGVPSPFPNTVQFNGTGLSQGDTFDIQYLTGDGTQHTAVYGGNTPNADGSWNILANFDLLGTGQTQVVSTVLEKAPDGTVLQTRALTFALAVAPNPANPFTVTYPGTTQVVDTTTPVFTGTGEPGADIVITYGARSVTEAQAGVGVVAADGTFSIPTDFSRLEPGDTDTRAIVTQTLNGAEVPGATRLAIAFSFETAPAPLIPLSLVIAPTSLTVDSVKSTDGGVSLNGTGFSPNEGLTITLTGADGVPVTITGADGVFADDVDGSYTDKLTLTGDVTPGTYTVTITGQRSERTVSAAFTVVANPVTANPAGNPATPGTNAGSAGNGTLASTGLDGIALGSLAGGLMLAGIALAAVRRRANA